MFRAHSPSVAVNLLLGFLLAMVAVMSSCGGADNSLDPEGAGTNGGSGSSAGTGTAPSISNAEPRLLVFGELLGSCCADRSSGDIAAMKFDSATSVLGPATEPLDYSDVVPTALAYRNAAGGPTIYAGQLGGGPEVQQPNGEAFSVDSNANIAPLGGNPFLAGSDAQSIAMHPSGNFVYFSQWDPNASGIAGYSVDATGIPQPLAGSPFYQFSIGGAGMVVEPLGRFLFAMPPSTNSSPTEVYTFPIAANGALATPTITTVSSSAISQLDCTCLQASPDGKYLYVASDSTIAALSIDPQNGTLNPVPGSPFLAGQQIASFAMSSDGNYLFALDGSNNTIRVFATNRSTTGIPTPAGLSAGPPTGGAPYALATQGHFVFVGSSLWHFTAFNGSTVTGSISVYSLDSNTGILTLQANFPTPGGPQTMIAVP